MCGLFGATSNYLSPQEIENVINLGIISCVRGKDSSGVVLVTDSKKKRQKFRTHMTKRTTSSASLLSDLNMVRFIHDKKKGDKYCILGHSRAATLGSITEANAHPHMHNHIIGTHNGTISDYVEMEKVEYTIKEDGKEFKKYYMRQVDPHASDSRVLFEKMATIGVIPAIRDAEEKKGAMALAFINYQNNTVNLYRNYQRPLFMAYSQDGSTLYWASEESIINVLRNAGDKWSIGIPIMVQPNTLHTFGLGSVARFSASKTPIEESKIILLPNRGNGANTSSIEANFPRKISSPTYRELWTGFNIHLSLDEEVAKKKLSVGCSMCTKISETWESTWWCSDIEHLCEDCYKSALVQEYAVEAGKVFIESTVEWKQ